MPWEQRYGIRGSRNSQYRFSRIVIGEFAQYDCGLRSRAFALNPTSHDWNPHVLVTAMRWAGTPFGVVDATRFEMRDFVAPGGTDHKCDEPFSCSGRLHTWLLDDDGSLMHRTSLYKAGKSMVVSPKHALMSDPCFRVTFGWCCLGRDLPAARVCNEFKPRLFELESADPDCCGVARRLLGDLTMLRLSDGESMPSPPMFDDLDCPRGVEYGNSWYPVTLEPFQEYELFFAPHIELPRLIRIFFFSENPLEYVEIALRMTRLRTVRVYVDRQAMPNLERLGVPETYDSHGVTSQSSS